MIIVRIVAAALALGIAAACAPTASKPIETADDIVAVIREDLREAFATGDDFTIVSAVRAWAYERIDRAGHVTLRLDSDYAHAWKTRGWVDLFNAVENDEGGFYCGGTAMMLAEIYKALGYQSTVLNYGLVENAATHVLTLVRIEFGGRAILSVQDAYFGYTVLDDGEPAHFGDLIAAIDADDFDHFTVEHNAGCKPLLATEDRVRTYVERFYPVTDLPGKSSHISFCHDFTLTDFLEKDPQGSTFLDAAESMGRSRDVFYLMLNQIGKDHSGLIDAAVRNEL